MNATLTNPHVRWMIRRDLADLGWEMDTAYGWDAATWIAHLKHRENIAVVLEANGVVVGVMAYSLLPGTIRINRLSVHPAYRRQGVATRLIRRLQDRFAAAHGRSITCAVLETDLRAQLLFRSAGFYGELWDDEQVLFTWEAE